MRLNVEFEACGERERGEEEVEGEHCGGGFVAWCSLVIAWTFLDDVC